MPIYSPSFSRYLADIAASYQPPQQEMSPEPPEAPGAPGAPDYSMHDTGAMTRAETDPNGTLYAYPDQVGDPRAHNLRFAQGNVGFPLQRLGNMPPPEVPPEHRAGPHDLVERKIQVGGGIGGKPHEETIVEDKSGSFFGNLVGKVTGDPRVGVTEEERKASDESLAKKKEEEAKKAEPFGPPPPPPPGSTFATKTAAKPGAPAAGGGAAGAAGPAGGSAAMSMSSTEPGTLAGGGNWEDPALAARAGLSVIGTANADIAEAEGEAAQRREEAANKAAAESARIEHEYDRVSQEHFNKLDQLNQEVAEGKIDPEHWARTRTTGQKVLYMLGAALGGFAAGFRPGTPNYAMEMIKQEVDNDIDAQRANLENKRHAAEGEKGILGEIYNRTHNMQQSVLLAKDLAYDHIGNQLQELTAASHSSIARANALLADAEWRKWEQTQKEHTAEFLAAESDKRMALMMRASRGRGGGAGANNKDVQKLAHEMATSHIPEMESAINQVQRDLKNGNGAGLGRIKTAILNHLKMGEGFLSREGKQTRQDLKAAQAEGARFVAGRYGGPSAKAMADMLDSGDPEQVQAALHYFNGRIGAIKQGIYAGHDPSTIGVYEDRVRSDAGGGGGGGEEDEPDLMPADEGH